MRFYLLTLYCTQDVEALKIINLNSSPYFITPLDHLAVSCVATLFFCYIYVFFCVHTTPELHSHFAHYISKIYVNYYFCVSC